MKVFRSEPQHGHHYSDEKVGLVDSLFVRRERKKPGFNRRMFDEDFARIFRPMISQSSNLFKVSSNDNELMEKLLGNVKTRYVSRSVDETIRKLVEEISQSLIWFGRAYYFLHDSTEQEETHLAPFSVIGIFCLFGTYIQWVPQRRERHWDENVRPREIRILDAAKIMRFDISRTIKRMLTAQYRTFTILDKYQFRSTDFYSQTTHEKQNPANHFDFRVWNDIQERTLYRATLNTGWNGRKFASLNRSDFFDCHRLIRFRRNQLLLRDDILQQLSDELSRVGKGYNTEFNVKISGTTELPSIAQLDELEARLLREEVGFNEIIDYCYER